MQDIQRKRLDERKRRSLLFSMLVMILTTMMVTFVTSRTAYADAPAAQDFGQGVQAQLPGWDTRTTRALFVTEAAKGVFSMEEHKIRDDAIVGFVQEHPAWRLNVPLTCYFLETVYERDTVKASQKDGRVAV